MNAEGREQIEEKSKTTQDNHGINLTGVPFFVLRARDLKTFPAFVGAIVPGGMKPEPRELK